MEKSIFTLFLVVLPLMAVCQKQKGNVKPNPNAGLHFNPPPTPRILMTNIYFGMKVIDNYRWVENLKAPNVLQGMKAQSTYAHNWLYKISARDLDRRYA